MDVEQWKTLVNFLRDGAKIFFGSFVVGTLASFPEKTVSWVLFFPGLLFTVIFLLLAINFARHIKKTYE